MSALLDHLPCLVLDDHGVDDFDDGFAIAFGETFEGLESLEQPAAGELGVIDGAAGEQVIDAGAERVGELDEHLGRRRDEATLVFVEQLVAGADRRR